MSSTAAGIRGRSAPIGADFESERRTFPEVIFGKKTPEVG
jgi:hypothetical protein